jgi:Zn-finger nucleic acid-binding protein
MSERQGIEIDYCPQCRGVWLDRGELDKIIERTGDVQGPPPSPPPPNRTGQGVAGGWTRPATPPSQQQPWSGDHHGHGHGHGGKRRKSWLEEIFD